MTKCVQNNSGYLLWTIKITCIQQCESIKAFKNVLTTFTEISAIN